ncbi:hypothetical protein L596_025464 [Steinernema carpocapsae]|uniref:DUF38 domain-containing protein n=1 Tax=Steinernema carpocapsae TaxID=34508 RepID=A0A4U5M7V1_STECR|nr:hypothetical protein L596_025464 [Steinernema carpocapsae]
MDALPAAFTEEAIALLPLDSVQEALHLGGDFPVFGQIALNRRFTLFIFQENLGTPSFEIGFDNPNDEKEKAVQFNYKKGYGNLVVSLGELETDLHPKVVKTVSEKQHLVRLFILNAEFNSLSTEAIETMSEWNISGFVMHQQMTQAQVAFVKRFQDKNVIRYLYVSNSCFVENCYVILSFLKQSQLKQIQMEAPIWCHKEIVHFWYENARLLQGKNILFSDLIKESTLEWMMQCHEQNIRNVVDSLGLNYDSDSFSVTHPYGHPNGRHKMYLVAEGVGDVYRLVVKFF